MTEFFTRFRVDKLTGHVTVILRLLAQVFLFFPYP